MKIYKYLINQLSTKRKETERSLISANAISRNGKYIDLCQFSSTVSEVKLFQFIPFLCNTKFVRLTAIKLTASVYTD